MDMVKTATGKEFPCDFFVTTPTPQQAYFRVLNTPFATVAAVFVDPKETVQLWFGDNYLAHYTKLHAVIPEVDAVQVVLEKE